MKHIGKTYFIRDFLLKDFRPDDVLVFEDCVYISNKDEFPKYRNIQLHKFWLDKFDKLKNIIENQNIKVVVCHQLSKEILRDIIMKLKDCDIRFIIEEQCHTPLPLEKINNEHIVYHFESKFLNTLRYFSRYELLPCEPPNYDISMNITNYDRKLVKYRLLSNA